MFENFSDDTLLTRLQTVRLLSVSIPTLDRLVKGNRIRSLRIGRRRLFVLADVKDFVLTQRTVNQQG